MKIDRIITMNKIKKKWRQTRDQYGADCVTRIPVPVISAGSLSDAEKMTGELAGYLYIEKILGKTNAGHGDYLFCPAPYTPRNDSNFHLIQDLYDPAISGRNTLMSFCLILRTFGWMGRFRSSLRTAGRRNRTWTFSTLLFPHIS